MAEAIEETVTKIAVASVDSEELEAVIATMELIKKRLANPQWLLTVLKVLDGGHEFFKKGYAYQKPRKGSSFVNLAVLPNEDGFYDGLPQLPPGRHRRFTLLTKE